MRERRVRSGQSVWNPEDGASSRLIPILASGSGRDQTESRREFLAGTLGVTTLLLVSPEPHGHSGVEKNDRRAEVGGSNAIPSASLMVRAAETFQKSLSAEQSAKITFPFGDDQRFNWHYIPRERKGIPFKELDPASRHLGTALLNAGLSQRGFIKAVTTMSLEVILRALEQASGPVRDPELYYFSLFGQPQSQKPWGYRVEGHHLSLNFTVVDDNHIASTPSFFGANPAEVLQGPQKGLRNLMAEEELGRSLLKSLDERQRREAVMSNSAPADILSGNLRKAEALKPAGILASGLSQTQSDLLMSLITEYAANMAPDIAAVRIEKLRSGGFGNISFAWAGGAERGQPHYYRIQGPTFLIEYDNTQNNANHIHTVWRDFNDDFGLDLLAAHYKAAHR